MLEPSLKSQIKLSVLFDVTVNLTNVGIQPRVGVNRSTPLGPNTLMDFVEKLVQLVNAYQKIQSNFIFE